MDSRPILKVWSMGFLEGCSVGHKKMSSQRLYIANGI